MQMSVERYTASIEMKCYLHITRVLVSPKNPVG